MPRPVGCGFAAPGNMQANELVAPPGPEASPPAQPEPSPEPAPLPASRSNFLRDLRWALSLFLVGLGAKFFLVFRFGTPLPFWDAWDSEARGIYVPYFTGKLTLAHLYKPHVEHRIFFTRLYDLVVFLLNGQWDGRLEMTGNAIMHCAAIAGLGWLMVRLMGRNIWPMIWLPLSLALVLPFGWESTLGGGQCFLLTFSLLSIWWLGLSQPLSARWWLGAASAIAALFTTGSGVFAAAAVFVMVLLDVVKEKRLLRRHLPTLAVCILIGVAGILLKPHVPELAGMKAHSIGDFFTALGRNIAWPRIARPQRFMINILPVLWLATVYFQSRKRNLAAEKMILGMGAWVLLQGMAVAYARGSGGAFPVSHYMDSSCVIMIVNWLSFTCLLWRHVRSSWLSRLLMVMAAVWAGDCLVGLWKLDLEVCTEALPERSFHQGLWLKGARAFMVTDDPRVLNRKREIEMIHPRPQRVAALLREPKIRRILPACVREPLVVVQANRGDGAFVPINDATIRWNTPAGPGWRTEAATNAAEVKFESLPLGPSSLPYLEFPVAGDLSDPGVSLGVRDLNTGRLIPIRLPQKTTERWQTVTLKAPAGKFEIVAANTSKAASFAFREPREVGRFSEWSLRILAAWKLFLWAGVACLLLNVALLARRLQSPTTG